MSPFHGSTAVVLGTINFRIGLLAHSKIKIQNSASPLFSFLIFPSKLEMAFKKPKGSCVITSFSMHNDFQCTKSGVCITYLKISSRGKKTQISPPSQPNYLFIFCCCSLKPCLVITMQVNFIIPFTPLVMNKFTAYYFGLDLWQNSTGTNNLICQPLYKDSSISVTNPNLKSKVHLTARPQD